MKNKSKLFKLFIVIDILYLIFLFFTYGPISYFRDMLVTTAKGTWHHQYLAYIFYTEDMVNDILENNYIKNFEFNTDVSQIIIGKETTNYESVYEEQILKKDEGNDLYKVIDIKGSNYVGRIIAIYDPTRISFVQSKKINYGGQILNNLAEDYDAIIAINASGFTVNNKVLTPTGVVIIDGKIVNESDDGEIIGFNSDGIMMLTYDDAKESIKKGMVYGMEFGPFLIVNGKKANTKGLSVGGIAPRTAIAQRKDGIVLFMTIDGRRTNSLGATFNDMIEIFQKYGAYNAANLDGGGSSSMTVNGEMINTPGGYGYEGARYIPNAWIVK